MRDIEALLARLETLEICVAHQDARIEDLDATITAQWAEIDRLKRHVSVLGDQIGDAESRAASTAPVQPPPHY